MPTALGRTAFSYAAGLIGGLGMASVLQGALQFGGTHRGVAVLSFSTGAIAGEIVTVLLMALALELAFQFIVDRRIGTVVLSAIAAHTAWHWMADRYAEFRKFPLRWPASDALFLIEVMRWAMVAVLIAATVWLFGVFQPLVARRGSASR